MCKKIGLKMFGYSRVRIFHNQNNVSNLAFYKEFPSKLKLFEERLGLSHYPIFFQRASADLQNCSPKISPKELLKSSIQQISSEFPRVQSMNLKNWWCNSRWPWPRVFCKHLSAFKTEAWCIVWLQFIVMGESFYKPDWISSQNTQ